MTMRRAPKRPRKTFPLRMPPELHSRLSAVAQREQRTLNAQIVYVIERWLEQSAR